MGSIGGNGRLYIAQLVEHYFIFSIYSIDLLLADDVVQRDLARKYLFSQRGQLLRLLMLLLFSLLRLLLLLLLLKLRLKVHLVYIFETLLRFKHHLAIIDFLFAW